MRRHEETFRGIVGITLFGGRRSPAARPGLLAREFGEGHTALLEQSIKR
jgi:hypothetical protein